MTKPKTISRRLLAWYTQEARSLPWRASLGERGDPYHVLLSEVLLQQTTVKAVVPHFTRLLHRWPSLEALAAAPLEELLDAWAGLGYYSRARNLHKTARILVRDHGGRLPEEPEALQRLPGIGPYTAAAIAALAFHHPILPLDANVERVLARLLLFKEPLPAAKPLLRQLAQDFVLPGHSGDLAQAFMDLGASLCTAAKPTCAPCPLRADCKAAMQGLAAAYPKKLPKPEKPTRYGVAFWILDQKGRIYLRRRPLQGLLAGMLEVPSTTWQATPPTNKEILSQAPLSGEWQALPGLVRHSFTHFHLELGLWASASRANEEALPGIWLDPGAAHAKDGAGLASLMRKIVAQALRLAGGYQQP